MNNKRESRPFLPPEEEREVAKKIKQQLEQMDTEVPYSLRPENIGPILNRPVQTARRHPLTTRWIAMAATFALVIGAVSILPRYLGDSNNEDLLTATGDISGESNTEAADPETSLIAENTSSEAASTLTRSKDAAATKSDYKEVTAALKKIAEYNTRNVVYGADAMEGASVGSVAATSNKSATASTSTTVQGTASVDDSDFSKTNIQVEGVDEPDIIKTDGKYLYTVTNQYEYNTEYGARVSIIQTDANGKMSLIKQFFSKDETVNAIFLESNRLILLKSPRTNNYYLKYSGPAVAYDGGYSNTNWTYVEIYDVTNPKEPKLTRRFEQEGYYSTARTLNGYLCLVSGKSVYNISGDTKPEEVIPMTADSLTGGKAKILPASAVHVMPDLNTAYFTTVTLLSISDASAAASTQAIMAAGETYYANLENIFVASARYDWTTTEKNASMVSGTSSTSVMKISLANGKVTPLSTGTVKGTLCSQYAMDEYEGYFRIATNLWTYDATSSTQTNNFYVLDKNMKTVGKLEGLAPGENMYSVRFSGKTVYAVTYRQTDPFFVIDLTDPTKPKVTGELKIPGFSNYLHPYSDKLVIGFGMDALEDSSGNTAITQGFKISMFDVTNPEKPVEVHKILIGDRGSYSSINYDPKALLFSKEKNLIGIPISITKSNSNDAWAYGETVFDGYIVLGYDPAKGFYEKGRVTHMSDLKNFQYDGTKSYQNISRGVYIGNILYTLSNNVILSTSLSTFEQSDKIELYYAIVTPSGVPTSSATSSAVPKPTESRVY